MKMFTFFDLAGFIVSVPRLQYIFAYQVVNGYVPCKQMYKNDCFIPIYTMYMYYKINNACMQFTATLG